MENSELLNLMADLETEEAKKDYSSFDNYSTKRVTLIGYLIGLKENVLLNNSFDKDYYQTIKDVDVLKIIRSLCLLRSSFIHNYDKIFQTKKSKGAFAIFDMMDKLIDVESLKYLRAKSIDPLPIGVELNEFTKYIALINQSIEDKIDSIHTFIPEWIEWSYIKDLFIMPGCGAGINGCNYATKKRGTKISDQIHEIRKDFFENISFYPYHTYINWNPKKRDDEVGNILFNDCKFLRLLYESNYDRFKGEQYVIDAKSDVKESIYDFIEQANNVAIFVDCENVDPYKFAAVFKNLDAEKVSKIRNIVLYDDENTTNAWDILKDILSIDVQHVEVERIKNDKSLVDHALSIGVTKSYYEQRTESAIIVSSDSDFWSLIKYMPNINFFVMNQVGQTCKEVLQKLDEFNIPHCYMDDFAQDAIQPYKNKVLVNNFQAILDEFNQSGHFEALDVDELLELIFRRSAVSAAYSQLEKEKQVFFNKYVKKMRLVFENDEETTKIKLIMG